MPSEPRPEQPLGRVVAVIPARLASQRLPGKMLRELAGEPLLAWTYAAARRCPQLDEVLVAVDSEEVAALCRARGWPWRMTSPALPSGTDRLYAVSLELEADVYLNIQGDEPLVEPEHIQALLTPFTQPQVEVSTLSVPCTTEELTDPNAVKVVTARDGRALYFSRSPIPFSRDGSGTAPARKHLGLYGYRRDALRRFSQLPPGQLEQVERLEQLRLLENGIALYVAEAERATVGVDTEEDLRRVEAILLRRGVQAPAAP
jgi:3-deoxy-manno-octulosonate cytidylyltransferase (CMP-KDO synthetase)